MIKLAIFLLLSFSLVNAKEPCIHVLIATIGRETLIPMLDSLQGQLHANDYLTVVFDAKDVDHVYEQTRKKLSQFACHTTIRMEKTNLGYWGHGIRNKYNQLPGDFILHGDDDDIYLPHAMDMVRNTVSQNSSALYIFQIKYHGHLISGNPIQLSNVSTQSGAIPSRYNSKARWGSYYGGDYEFYAELQKIVPQVIYSDQVIYQMRPHLEVSAL